MGGETTFQNHKKILLTRSSKAENSRKQRRKRTYPLT